MKKLIAKIAIPVIALIGLVCIARPITVASDSSNETTSIVSETTTTVATTTEITTVETTKTYSLGDVNGDGRVDAVDASFVLGVYAKSQTDSEEKLSEPVREAADVNKDEYVDAVDASDILSYYAYVATTENPISIEDFMDTKYPKSSPETKEKIYFKPNTHYIHRASCRWCNEALGANETLIEITDTSEIECRVCTECNPEITVINPYIESTPVATAGIDDYSRRLLAEIAWHEAGSNWISQYNKAKVVAGVMNRVNDPRFPNTVYGVLVDPYQFPGYWPGCCEPSQACWDAVNYYFNHTNEFNSDNSWFGDGYQNHFYYQ